MNQLNLERMFQDRVWFTRNHYGDHFSRDTYAHVIE